MFERSNSNAFIRVDCFDFSANFFCTIVEDLYETDDGAGTECLMIPGCVIERSVVLAMSYSIQHTVQPRLCPITTLCLPGDTKQVVISMYDNCVFICKLPDSVELAKVVHVANSLVNCSVNCSYACSMLPAY